MTVGNSLSLPQSRLMETVCCIGAGYVGGPSMAVLALMCPAVRVVVVDKNEEVIDRWNSSNLPIYEPGLEDIVAKCRGRNLFFSKDIERAIDEADVIFICVNTPTKGQGVGRGFAPDTATCEECARTIAKASKSDKIVVEKSTVPVRMSRAIEDVLSANSNGSRFDVVSNPEFMSEGTAIEDLLRPSRILIGGKETPRGVQAAEQVARLYQSWVPRERIMLMSAWSAELSKLAANAMLAQRISSINALSAVCEATEASVSEVSRAVGADPRIGDKFLNASVGFGGSCLQKDLLSLVYLCQQYNLPEVADYWLQVYQMNEYQKDRFVKTIISRMFGTVSGKTLTLWGFAFKKDTGDTRSTAAAYVVRKLCEEGARTVIYDPKVEVAQALRELEQQGMNDADHPGWKEKVTFESNPYASVAGADAIAILTEWEEFKSYDFKEIYAKMRKPAFIFDGRIILGLSELERIGFYVYCIGQSSKYEPWQSNTP